VRPVIGPPDFLRDPLGALLFVARLALEALLLDARRALEEVAPLLRAEELRERPVVEPLLRGLPPEPLLPLPFTFGWDICPPKIGSPCCRFQPNERGDSGYRPLARRGPAPLPTAPRYCPGR
jgi:hypothetical protein